MTSTSLAEVASVLRPARRVLIVTHVAPDGDAIGSLLGASWLLRTGRSLTLACADSVPVQFRALPGAGEIVTDPPPGTWDAVLALDASDTRRLGSPFRPAEYGSTPVINLDHHVTNLYYGMLNYVDPSAAATAQIIVALHDAMDAPITREAAVCLLTGLVTDTLSFRTSNVSPAVMATAMRLMESGANLAQITEQSFNYKPLSVMRLWGLALSDLCLQSQVLWVRVTQKMRAEVGAPPDGDGSLVSYLINAPEAKIAAVFSETVKGEIEIGFRARPGYDVSGLALTLGGGGHPQAAGCTIPGPLKAAEARVLPLLIAAVAMGAGNGTSQRILNLNKPAAWTSHDVVARVRRLLVMRQVGHAGTLDPLATGVLLVCVGQATRVVEYLQAGRKVYRAVIRFGLVTDTRDLDGKVLDSRPVAAWERQELEPVLRRFAGPMLQTPPAYSAIKQGGVPAYRRARRGEEVEMAPRPVTVYDISLLQWERPDLTVEITCSAGTYVRSLAHDLGQALGCGAALASLTRTRSGLFALEQSTSLEELAEDAARHMAERRLHPLRAALSDLIEVTVDAEEEARLRHGLSIASPIAPDAHGYALGPQGDVVAILAPVAEPPGWRPAKVFSGVDAPTAN